MTKPFIENNTSDDNRVIEQLIFEIPLINLDKFLKADAEIWTNFLKKIPGFIKKISTYQNSIDKNDGNVKVNFLIFWKNYESWKNIKKEDLVKTQEKFVLKYGNEHLPKPIHNENGWKIHPKVD